MQTPDGAHRDIAAGGTHAAGGIPGGIPGRIPGGIPGGIPGHIPDRARDGLPGPPAAASQARSASGPQGPTVSVEEATALHALVLARFGGADGIRDRGALDAALARPWLGFGGQCVASTPSERAALIMDGVISSHPFVDSNKRTGVALAGLVLHKEGYELKLERGELHDLAMGLATHALGTDHVAATLERGMSARGLEHSAERAGARAATRRREAPRR